MERVKEKKEIRKKVAKSYRVMQKKNPLLKKLFEKLDLDIDYERYG